MKSQFGRRDFLRTAGVGLAGVGVGLAGSSVVGPSKTWPDERAMARAEGNTTSFALLRREQERRKSELPKPADFYRLPLSWNKAKARQLKALARERGVTSGLFITNRWNLIHATGLHHSTTERPFAAFLPMDDDDGCIWLYPHLDEDLVGTWWATGKYSYFDYHHAEGGWPNRSEVRQGRTINIHRWWGETLASIGYGSGTIGIDSGGQAEIGLMPGHEIALNVKMSVDSPAPTPYRPTSGAAGQMASAMPDAQFINVGDIFVRSRSVKDEMENRLTQLAMDYWSEIHAFARNYILERGVGTLDWEVANAAQLWGMHRIMQDVPQDGSPHIGVGIAAGGGCRTGRVTAFPHPNQVRWSPIERGDALQFSGVTRIGGYGGEQYRSFLIAPWTDWQEHVWEVHTESYYIQAKESYEGNTCSNVAKAVHDYQVANDVQHLVYHRPGHGVGMEGHQPPYQALGDYTVLEKGMHFSNEPGLFDFENGFGFNHSNNILVWEGKGLQMGTAPADREWCLLEL